MSACSPAKEPKVSFCPKSRGSLLIGEESFEAEIDFTAEKKILLKGKQNPFSTVYVFEGMQVKLRYDTLESTLEIDCLPDTNPALLMYRVCAALQEGTLSWEKSGERRLFHGKINQAACSGECDARGKILSFEVPEYQLYYKAVE